MLNPYTQQLIIDYLIKNGDTPLPISNGLPGLHAEVQSFNDVMNYLDSQNIDLSSYDLSHISIATYKVSYDNVGGQGNPFKVCNNCTNIIPEEVNIITGR